jgi:beta-glucosidase
LSSFVQAVYAAGKPVIVVLLNGRPMSINWVNKYVPAIIEAWFPGAQGGTAIADVLFGSVMVRASG